MSMKVFDTKAAYLTAKASGGAIYTEMSTNSTLSRSVTSYIKDIGRTVIDAVNVIVDEPYGEIGDILIEKGGEYFWCKSVLAYSATSLGGVYGVKNELQGAGYNVIGALLHRDGHDGLICALDNASNLAAWSNNTSVSVPNVTTKDSIRVNRSKNNTAFSDAQVGSLSREWVEDRYPSSYYQYTMPFPRPQWDAMVTAVKSNTTSSGASAATDTKAAGADWNWSTTATTDGTGLATARFTCAGTSTFTNVNPKDYDYNFEKWYDANILVAYRTGVGAMSDTNGMANTKALIAWAAATSNTVPAATAANGYTPTTVATGGTMPSAYAAGKWWLPALYEGSYFIRNYLTLRRKGVTFTITVYWMSTQYSASNAWCVYFNNASANNHTKTTAYYVRAVSAYRFKDA